MRGLHSDLPRLASFWTVNMERSSTIIYICVRHTSHQDWFSEEKFSKVWLSVSFWCFGFCCLSQLSQSPAVPRSVQSELLSFNKVFRFMIQTDCFVLSLTCESNTTTKIFLRNLSFIISSCHFSVFRHNIRTLESRSKPGQYKNQLLFPSFLPPHWLYFFSLFPKDVRWYIQLQLVIIMNHYFVIYLYLNLV